MKIERCDWTTGNKPCKMQHARTLFSSGRLVGLEGSYSPTLNSENGFPYVLDLVIAVLIFVILLLSQFVLFQ